jgi:hypothetical protein
MYWISRYNIHFLKKTLLTMKKGKVPLLHRMIPADINNLYFIGLFQPLGCIWPGAELQSKLAVKHLSGQLEAKKTNSKTYRRRDC